MCELLIKGGLVIDPAQGIHEVGDIAVSQGRIAALGQALDTSQAERVIDARGKIVTPGLIDLHAHVYEGISPDRAGVEQGVTTVVDAGTTGSATFADFEKSVLPHSRTTTFCFLNLAARGLSRMPEIRDRRHVDIEATRAVLRGHRDVIKGMKVRVIDPFIECFGLEGVKLAKGLAREVGGRLMVHIGDHTGSKSLTRELLPLLEEGDILSHIYTAKAGTVLRSDDTVIPELPEAAARGVYLDVAHGRFYLSFRVARRLLAQGIVPSTISTDLTRFSLDGPVYSLTETMSKFLALGLELDQVIAMTTINPARALGTEDRMGSLRVGLPADISLLEQVEGDWSFTDTEGQLLKGKTRLVARMAIKFGEPILTGSLPSMGT